MDLFELTRALIDIESITINEERVGNFLYMYLSQLATEFSGHVERIEVEARRFNIFAQWGDPLQVTLSTHMDTVPPYIASREDEEFVWGRGACDTKGIIAAMIKAVEGLLESGERGFGLLFVVGEERNSAGAYKASRDPRGSKYIINGEPTENKLALGSKGALRYEVAASGKMAHSAYPELGDSAIHKLIDALAEVRRIPLPVDALLGPSTLNIGTLAGGRAPNVVADEAKADIMIRLVGDSTETKAALHRAVEGRAELREVIEIPALLLNAVEGIPTTVVAYTSDIPAFAGQWGEPFLIGPGTIHVAHTLEERVPKAQLIEAVQIYQQMVKQLCKKSK
ncbi:MAG TPA: M20/M25/M40 family metallo-hydrolase [Candidatus Acidoferrales bacterium]|jgi:acetylornithine deacetylase|nr:M20/M25/M40 family metallo-hydrolase [Candidatus Acidoferrales bacterium]